MSSTVPCLPKEFQDILALGPKHIPIPKDIPNATILSQTKKFLNSCLWSYFFKDEKEDPNYDPNFYLKKGRKFDHRLLPSSDPIYLPLNKIQQVTSDFVRKFKPRQNISHEIITLKRWQKQNPQEIITLTDKNLGFAIVDTISYFDFCSKHLQSTTYDMISTTTENFKNMTFYKNIVNEYLDLLNSLTIAKNLYSYLEKDRDFNLPKFHILPKIHKQTKPIPTRPIVGALNWLTTPYSKVLDKLIQPHLSNLPHILKNSQTLCHDLATNLNSFDSNLLLVTLDIESLYTNIKLPLLEQLLAEENNQLSRICNFITRNNFFEFNNSIYHQKDGLAMGTNAAVNLANFYLGKLLDTKIASYPLVKYYKRYIDDLFLIWTGNVDDLNNFLSWLNQLIPKIKFTMNYSECSVDFLDLTLFRTGTELHWKTYFKSISKFLYITQKSFHPKHTLKGMIIGELTRYKRNSSHEAYFVHSKKEFYFRLLKRGFTEKYLIPIFLKFQWDNYKNPSQEKTRVIPFILPYSLRPGMKELVSSIQHNIEDLKLLLPEHKIFLSYSKSRNVSQILCKSALTTVQTEFIQSSKS